MCYVKLSILLYIFCMLIILIMYPIPSLSESEPISKHGLPTFSLVQTPRPLEATRTYKPVTLRPPQVIPVIYEHEDSCGT